MRRLIFVAVMLFSPVVESQTCAYQDACFSTACGMCDHLGSQSFGESAKQMGGMWCSSDNEDDGYVDCSWCGPPVTDCATSNSPWGTTNGHATVCELCWAGHNVGTAILCTPFHCGAPSSTYCNTVQCDNYCV